MYTLYKNSSHIVELTNLVRKKKISKYSEQNFSKKKKNYLRGIFKKKKRKSPRQNLEDN